MSDRRRAVPGARALRGLVAGGAAGDAGRAGSRRIAGNAALQLAARVLQVVSGLITLPLLARALGPGDFGVWVAALAYVGLFMSFTELGLTNAATMKMSAEPEHESQWLAALSSLRMVVALTLTAVCAAGIPLFLSGDEGLQLAALILSAAVLLAGASSLMAVFTSRLRGGVPLVIGLLQTVMWLSIVVAVSVLDAGPVTLAVCYLAMLTTIAAVQITAVRRLASLSYVGARARWRGLLAVALPLGVGGLLVTVYYRIDSVLVFQLAGKTEAGIYGAAYRFLDTLTFFPAAVISALMPVFAATYVTDPARTRALVQRAADLMVTLGAPAVAVALVLSPQIIELLFSDVYARSAEVLPILMASFLAICLGTLGGYLAPVVGLRWGIAAIAGVCVVVNVGLNLVLIPRYGAVGAAWVTSATEGLSATLLLAFSFRAMRFGPSPSRSLRAVLASVVMGGALLVVEPLGLVPALAAGAVVYGAAVFALRVISLSELRGLRS